MEGLRDNRGIVALVVLLLGGMTLSALLFVIDLYEFWVVAVVSTGTLAVLTLAGAWIAFTDSLKEPRPARETHPDASSSTGKPADLKGGAVVSLGIVGSLFGLAIVWANPQPGWEQFALLLTGSLVFCLFGLTRWWARYR